MSLAKPTTASCPAHVTHHSWRRFLFYLYVFLFFFFTTVILSCAAIPCTCRWSTAMIRDRCCQGAWTGRCRRRCECCTRSCRPTGSAWALWRPCSTCGPTRRSSRVCYSYRSPLDCCRLWPRPTTACPSSGCRPCNEWTRSVNSFFFFFLSGFARGHL